MLNKTAGEIARILDGKLEGDPEVPVQNIGTLSGAGADDLAVLRDEQYSDEAAACKASVLVAGRIVEGFEGAHILVDDPETALADLLEIAYQNQHLFSKGISENARISPDAALGEHVSIGDFSFVGAGAVLGDGCVIFPMVYIGPNVQIGDRTVIHPHASIMDSVRIGRECEIKNGCVIGDPGFGFIQRGDSSRRLRHVGSVRIGDNVEIGAQSSIDRGMIEDTTVGDGTKIDKHCMIAHNCKIGKNCLLAGYARMAGSVRIGDGAVLAADVRVSDHKTIGAGAVMAAGTGVTRDVEPGEVVWGVPTRPLKAQARLHALEGRLPDLFKRVRRLEKNKDTGDQLRK